MPKEPAKPIKAKPNTSRKRTTKPKPTQPAKAKLKKSKEPTKNNSKPRKCTQDDFIISPRNRKGEVEVSSLLTLATTSGTLTFRADTLLLNELSEMPKERVKTCLYELIARYSQHRFISYTAKTTGSHSHDSKRAWTTARVLFPRLLSWAKEPGRKNTKAYKTVVQILRKKGYTDVTSSHIAAYLTRKNSENFMGKPWPGKDPCINPDNFQRRLGKKAPIWNYPRGAPTSEALTALNIPPEGFDVSSASVSQFVEAVLNGSGISLELMHVSIVKPTF